LLVSGYPTDKSKALFINQETWIYGGKLAKGSIIEHKISHQAYILASDGMFKVEDSLKNGHDEQGWWVESYPIQCHFTQSC
jgi:hypothetical protein